MTTYEEYQKQPRALTFEKMQELHQELLAEIANDSEAEEIYEEMMEKAEYYAIIRAKWMRMSREEKMEKDSLRTSAHDSVITHFNMLARYLRMQGKKAAWRDFLGDEKADPYVRKTIGDFACYLIFIDSVNAR